MSQLFSPYKIKRTTFKNRIFVSPMCQYSSEDGMPNDWHMVHLGSRAVGGAGLVMAEATGVSPVGRISPGDTGLWNEAQAAFFKRISHFVREQGSHLGIQLAHAGRKASTARPWDERKALTPDNGGWPVIAPSALPFSPRSLVPREMNAEDMCEVVAQFVASTKLALAADFEVVELHMAHGYLLHEFLSPLSNKRHDAYGGDLEARMKFPLEVARAVREVWPAERPLFARISATDWAPGGWDLEQSIEFSARLKDCGVDLIDCSTGGTVPEPQIPLGPGYQVPFASEIRKQANVPTGAVGMITEAWQAEDILVAGHADVVLLAREMLRDPYWPLHAARELGVDVEWPKQYARAK